MPLTPEQIAAQTSATGTLMAGIVAAVSALAAVVGIFVAGTANRNSKVALRLAADQLELAKTERAAALREELFGERIDLIKCMCPEMDRIVLCGRTRAKRLRALESKPTDTEAIRALNECSKDIATAIDAFNMHVPYAMAVLPDDLLRTYVSLAKKSLTLTSVTTGDELHELAESIASDRNSFLSDARKMVGVKRLEPQLLAVMEAAEG